MKITTQKNQYTLRPEVESTLRSFEAAASELFPEWELEHFYYGSELVMTTLKNRESGEYAEFYIRAKGVRFAGSCTILTEETWSDVESLTKEA